MLRHLRTRPALVKAYKTDALFSHRVPMPSQRVLMASPRYNLTFGHGSFTQWPSRTFFSFNKEAEKTSREEPSNQNLNDQAQSNAQSEASENKEKPKYKVQIEFSEEDSQYDEKPLAKAKIPRDLTQETVKKVDKQLPIIERVVLKIKFVTTDFVAYLQAIIFLDRVTVVYKTKEFGKRQRNRMTNLYKLGKREAQKFMKGFRRFREDIKFYRQHQQELYQDKYTKVSSAQDVRKIRQVKKDFIKFIPFSIFLLLPGAEFLLPAWVVIFPNAIPSQFLSAASRSKHFRLQKERRSNAAEKLLYMLPKYLYELESDNKVEDRDKEKIRALKQMLRRDGILPTDLLQYRLIFTKYAQFKYFDTAGLHLIAHFMSLNPITGLNIVNNLLGLLRLPKVPIDWPIIRLMTKALLTRELKMYFKRLRHEDQLMSFEDIEKYPEETLDTICFRRGIEVDDKTIESKIKDLKLWMSISNLRNVPDSLLLFSRITDFTEDLFELDESDDEYEILKASNTEIYVSEKIRVFEKTFGIDELQTQIREIDHRRKTQEYNPAEGKFLFTEKELENHTELLEEFKTKHQTLSKQIEKTYRISNKSLDYLEKQLILDSHLRGEQDQLEKKRPELVEKAKKYLGFELYYDLSKDATGGKPLNQSNPNFTALMQKFHELDNKIENDLNSHYKAIKEQY